MKNLVRLKDLGTQVISRLTILTGQCTIHNIKAVLLITYQELKNKLSDLKVTNWELAHYHLLVGNFNDAILRFKIVQYAKYKIMESNYYLGMLYVYKKKYLKARKYIELYLESNELEFRDEAEYYLNIITNKKNITYIPHSIIALNRNRKALSFSEGANIDQILLSHYHAIITALKKYVKPGSQILDIGCFIGVFGKMLRSMMIDNIQYLGGVDIANNACIVAQNMSFINNYIYDDVQFINEFSEILQGSNIYSIVVISDIIRYYNDLNHLFEITSNILQADGIGVIVYRLIKNSINYDFTHIDIEDVKSIENTLHIPSNSSTQDCDFVKAVEEFSYSPQYILSVAKIYNLQSISSIALSNNFALLIFKKQL